MTIVELLSELCLRSFCVQKTIVLGTKPRIMHKLWNGKGNWLLEKISRHVCWRVLFLIFLIIIIGSTFTSIWNTGFSGQSFQYVHHRTHHRISYKLVCKYTAVTIRGDRICYSRKEHLQLWDRSHHLPDAFWSTTILDRKYFGRHLVS